MINKKTIGSDFDDFLNEYDILEETESIAIKRVLIHELNKKMIEEKITKTFVAEKLKTSRSSLDRILNPENNSMTITTMERIAKFLGRKLIISFG